LTLREKLRDDTSRSKGHSLSFPESRSDTVRKRNPTDLNAAEAFGVPNAAALYSVGANVFFDVMNDRGPIAPHSLHCTASAMGSLSMVMTETS
jgi:hypothetical protein